MLQVMNRTLITMPGKFGDLLWTLPAVRQLARGEPSGSVDFAMMPKYSEVLRLLRMQRFIGNAYQLDGWVEEHDWCGAQPMIPPSIPAGYERVFNLGYKEAPAEPLYLEAYKQLGLAPVLPLVPFIEVPPGTKKRKLISYSFNGQDLETESRWVETIVSRFPGIEFVDTSRLRFELAAVAIAESLIFFGCRSSNYVIAHGVGTRIVTLETIPGRRHVRFSFPWGWEALIDPPDVDAAILVMRRWFGELG